MIRVPMNVARLLAAGLVLVPAVALARPKPSPWKSAVLKFDRLGGKLSIGVDKSKRRFLDAALTSSKVTDASLKGLADLVPGQQRVAHAVVELAGTRITDKALTELAKLGRKVPVALTLGKTGITDAGLKNLKGATITILALDGTKVTDAGLKELKGLKGLSALSLSSTGVSDAGMKELKKLTLLQTLDLGGTKLTDVGLGELKGLSRLRLLDLSKTAVTPAAVATFKKALPKCKIIQ